MKRIIGLWLAVLLILMPCAVRAEKGEGNVIGVESPMAVLMDAATGQVLLQVGADAKAPAASAIKVMTLLVVYDSIAEGRMKMEDSIQVSANAAKAKGTSAFLDSGSSYKAEELVKAVSICSANDAAIALAEALYGSETAFVDAMNQRAKGLGAKNTVFTTCTGLDDANAHTTAYDLALFAKALSEHKSATEHTAIYMDQITHKDGRVTELTNPNRLVRFYTGCDGYATGSSDSAKYCGVFTAKKGEMRLIAVTLGAKDSDTRFNDARAMMDYGFSNFTTRVLAKKGEILRKNVEIPGGSPKYVNLVAKDDIKVVLERGEASKIKKEIELNGEITAPVEMGQSLGTLYVYTGEKLIAQTDAIAESTVKRSTIWEAVLTILRYWTMG
ncbi:MAG: D-alanyl-D-alanine carboxypeptidase [Clostridiales bacterium]|nr:D-alanyl-D-alanine carboxypeptidase [Clostridiales bacterium]